VLRQFWPLKGERPLPYLHKIPPYRRLAFFFFAALVALTVANAASSSAGSRIVTMGPISLPAPSQLSVGEGLGKCRIDAIGN